MTTIYHIYHAGKDELSCSIHTISDSNVILKTKTETASPQLDGRQSSDLKPQVLRRQSTLSKISTKVKRSKSYDDPKFDPRTESSPYFIHCPKLAFRRPPYTLRYGGMKTTPVTALMHPNCGWRTWRLEFGDVLSQPGVIDRRGVVSLNHGTLKGEDGTLRGYGVRSFRMAGESGKAWFKEQKALKQQPIHESTKAKPEEVVELKWVSPFSFRAREYRFTWRGYDFVWKGTGKPRPNTIFRPLLRFNHLKLIVLIPQVDEKGRAIELTLASYTSAASSRKMGRLELDQKAMVAFLTEYILEFEQVESHISASEDKKPCETVELPQDSTEKTQQRMTDVIMATGMSMIIGEYQKRQVIVSIILAAAGEAGG